jgi:hypothetical protein
VHSRETKIKGIEWQKLGVPHPPRFQQSNLELIRLMDLVKTDGGAVLNAGQASRTYQARGFVPH